MAIAHLQDNSTTTTSAAPPCAFTSNVTQGDLLVVLLMTLVGIDLMSAPTDTIGTTYALAGGSTGPSCILYTGIAPSSGTNTATCHLTASQAAQVSVAEFSGVLSPTPDLSPASTTASSTAVLSANASGAHVPNELFVSFFRVATTAVTSIGAPSGGFTAMDTGTFGGWAYLIGTGTTAHQCGWTIAPSRTWTAFINTFEPAVFTPANTMRSFVPQMRASNWMERAKGLLVPERERLILPRLALAR